MAPKARYTLERVAAIAEESVSKARANIGTALDVRSCGYVSHTACSPDMRRDTELTFRWSIQCRDYEAHCEVVVRCDNAFRRGVPFPVHWETALSLIHI